MADREEAVVPSLLGKVVIVTGASRGIGKAIALKLADEGAKLALTARSETDLENVAAEVRRRSGEAFCFAGDLRLSHVPFDLVSATRDRFGAIDCVVTNAGAAKSGDFLELNDDDWADGFALKFFAHVRLLKAVWSDLSARRGSVVIIAGRAARTPTSNTTITGAVNAALNNLTKALASRGIADGVRVNAVNPGAVRTERYTERMAKLVAKTGSSLEQAERDLIEKDDIIGIGEAGEIAEVVAFLLGPSSSYMQGSLVDVDGGRTKSV